MAIDPGARMNSRITDIMRPWPRLARLRLSRRILARSAAHQLVAVESQRWCPTRHFLKGDKQWLTERFLLTA
jgi:hypothetical protein